MKSIFGKNWKECLFAWRQVKEMARISSDKKGDVLFFLGAGVSMAITNDQRSLWTGLLRDGILAVRKGSPENFSLEEEKLLNQKLDSAKVDELIDVASVITEKLEQAHSQRFSKWLESSIGNLRINNTVLIDEIAKFNFPLITTNYDTLISKILEYDYYSWHEKDAAHAIMTGNKKDAVLHLHGHWKIPEKIVFDKASYDEILHSDLVQALLKGIVTYKTIVFIGYGAGMDDPNFYGFINWLEKFGIMNDHNKHYILVQKNNYDYINTTANFPGNIKPISYGEQNEDLPKFLRRVRKLMKGKPVWCRWLKIAAVILCLAIISFMILYESPEQHLIQATQLKARYLKRNPTNQHFFYEFTSNMEPKAILQTYMPGTPEDFTLNTNSFCCTKMGDSIKLEFNLPAVDSDWNYFMVSMSDIEYYHPPLEYPWLTDESTTGKYDYYYGDTLKNKVVFYIIKNKPKK